MRRRINAISAPNQRHLNPLIHAFINSSAQQFSNSSTQHSSTHPCSNSSIQQPVNFRTPQFDSTQFNSTQFPKSSTFLFFPPSSKALFYYYFQNIGRAVPPALRASINPPRRLDSRRVDTVTEFQTLQPPKATKKQTPLKVGFPLYISPPTPARLAVRPLVRLIGFCMFVLIFRTQS